MDWSGFGAGWYESQDKMERNRREMAQAFEQFKRNNPYATVEDYQAYIDQMSGGSNYMRGGAPSKTVLESLAADNLKQKQVRDSEQTLNQLIRENQFRESIQKQADNALLGGDLTTLGNRQADFIKSLGKGADVLGEDWINSQFTPDRFNRMSLERDMKLMPTAMEYFKSVAVNGKLPAGAKAQFQSALGLQPYQVDGLVKRLEDQYKKDETDYFLQRTDAITQQLNSHVAGGGDAEKWIDDFNKQPGVIPISDERKQVFLGRAEEQVNRRNIKLEEEANTAFVAIRKDINASTEVNDAFLQGDILKARELIANSFISDMNDSQFELKFGMTKEQARNGQLVGHKIIVDMAQGETDAANTTQEANYLTRSDAAKAKALEVADERIKADNRAFTDSFNDANPVLQVVASQLATQFHMNGPAQSLAAGIMLSDKAKNVNDPNELRKMVMEHPNWSSVTRISDSTQNITTRNVEAQGIFKPEPVADFLKTNADELEQITTQSRQYFEQAMDAQDPNQRLQELGKLANQIQVIGEANALEMALREKNALYWVRRGTKPWDQKEIEAHRTQTEAGLSTLLEQVQAEIANAQQSIAQSIENQRAFNPDQSQADMLDGYEIGDVVEINGQLMEVVPASGQGSRTSKKRFRPVAGPTRAEADAYLANAQIGDIINHNGLTFIVQQNTGKTSRTRPLKLVPQ